MLINSDCHWMELKWMNEIEREREKERRIKGFREWRRLFDEILAAKKEDDAEE